MHALRGFLWAALLASGCGFLDASTTPVVEAHRAGAGYWPENSRAAVMATIERGDPGIEFDLALTSDRVPVLVHDPWLSAEKCTTENGELLAAPKPVQELTFDELRSRYRCGGVADPATPTAQLIAEPLMSFDEALLALQAAPEMTIHLDIKYEPDSIFTPEIFAEEILGRWERAGLPNPVYATANLAELLAAFKERSPEMTTSLIWPRFPPGSSATPIALGAELTTVLGVEDLTALARRSHADGLCIPYQVLDRQAVEFLRQEGLRVQVWTLNTKALLSTYCRWPVDAVITDFPEDAPCR